MNSKETTDFNEEIRGNTPKNQEKFVTEILALFLIATESSM